MKKLTYKLRAAMGPDDLERSGTLFDLLNSIPYFLRRKRLPPLVVINEILSKGVVDSGMSGGVQWTPFAIEEKEYDELAQHCESLSFEIARPPKWVTTRSYFQIWEFELDHGVPAEQHKSLVDLSEEAGKKLKSAIANGEREAEILRLHLNAIDAGNALADFINRRLS